jgi:glutamate racemase
MDARPIGVFDSGLGGLTTVKKLAELLPEEDIVYLGDTGRAPYGSRSRETIIKYARQDADFLVDRNIKAMVIACNTVCSVAFNLLEGVYAIPVYEVVSAPAMAAAVQTKNGRIGVIGTAATIRSGAYEAALKRIEPELCIFSTSCPLFVPLAENGRISANDTASLAIAGDYLEGIREFGADTLILGCTHYPLMRDVISKVIGAGVVLIDSGSETAKLVAKDLQTRGMMAPGGSEGKIKYFVTDSTDGFSGLASRFLESDIYGMVEQIVIE